MDTGEPTDGSASHFGEEPVAISVIPKHLAAIVPTLYHVERGSRLEPSEWARHDDAPSKTRTRLSRQGVNKLQPTCCRICDHAVV